MPAWTPPSVRTPGHDAQTAASDAGAAERAQEFVTAQRAELHLDLTDDAVRNLATRPDTATTDRSA
jgi:hypothetical protein